MLDPGYIAKTVIDLAVTYLKPKLSAVGRTDTDLRISLERHLAEVAVWSSHHQFYGMSNAEETEASTIPLRLAAEPRRFRRRDASATIYGETDLLRDPHHQVMLGDPGAGKTTTLKRLARQVLCQAPIDDADIYQFPVVIRLRELEPSDSLYRKLARELDIPFTDTPSYAPGKKPTPNEHYVGEERLENFIATFFNTSSALLLLDGLDEVVPAARPVINHQLVWLARNLLQSKIVVSCRTGDFQTNLEGYNLLELCPLDADEVRNIAKVWLANTDEFLTALAALPYQDLLDRPLLLTQLLFIFKRYGYLPEQPSQIYKKVIALLLYKWDTERQIVRKSRYAAFDPERKAEFLAGVSYFLTYRAKAKTFSARLLADAYNLIHARFGLPAHEMEQVVSEIETHTGIISVAGYDTYEFSHLSLQEYLCADYLVREPFAEHLTHYLNQYPSPVAIAVTLSSNPSTWFAATVLRAPVAHGPQSMRTFMSRLFLEHPMFTCSPELGAAIMKLFFTWSAYKDIQELLLRLLTLPNVMDSVRSAMPYFRVDPGSTPAPRHFVAFRVKRPLPESRDFPITELLYLPRSIYLQVADVRDVV